MTDAAQEAKVEKTAIHMYQYFQDVCSWCLLNHDAPLMLGGTGSVVQIDESLFRHKPKVNHTFAYHIHLLPYIGVMREDCLCHHFNTNAAPSRPSPTATNLGVWNV